MRILLATLVASLRDDGTPSQRAERAVEPPLCLISAFGGERCSLGSLEACLRDGVGGGGLCNLNPRYRGAALKPARSGLGQR